jgi:succinate dehydrogenase cytochrome b556 subunit
MKQNRPLSPHIFIYKPQISSLFSVFHRTSGIILALGILFFIFFIEFFSYYISYFSIYSFASFLDSSFV